MKTHMISRLLIAAALGATALGSSLLAASHDQDPRAISAPAPKYPYELKRAEVEGAVLVSFTITAQGDVTDVVAVKSTDRNFAVSAVNAVKSWKFAPATKDGQAVNMPALQIVTYSLTGGDTVTPLATLVETMQPRHPLLIAASHDRCFCGSGRMFNECHGTGKLLVVATK
jgi:TonB family protein